MSTEDTTPDSGFPAKPPLPAADAAAASAVPPAPGTPSAPDAGAAPVAADNAPTAAPAPPVNHKRRNVLIAAGVAAVLVVGGGIAGIVAVASQPTPLERVGEACAGTAPLSTLLDEEDGEPLFEDDGTLDEYFEGVVSVEDDGRTLILQTLPEDDDPLGLSTLALDCVQTELDMPTWLTTSMGQTRSLDGRQSEQWDAFSAQWSYHPDNGVNLIIMQR